MKPYNNYIWPSEQWVCEREVTNFYADFRYRIEVREVVLEPGADPIWTTSGFLWDIDGRPQPAGAPRHVWQSRDQAIRADAARMIRMARRIVRRGEKILGSHRTPEIIAWARHVVERETGRAAKRIAPFKMPTPPKPKPNFDGLPLLQWGSADA